MQNLKQNTQALQQQIANLFLQFPEMQDDEVLRADMLEGATDLDQVLTLILRGIEDAKALRDGTKLRQDELKGRQERFEARIEFLRELALRLMQTAEIKKRELPEATLSIRAGSQQLVGTLAPEDLPDDLVKITRAPDKVKIREALVAGREVPGVLLSNAPPSLTVRVK